jgi:hypothetical protein
MYDCFCTLFCSSIILNSLIDVVGDINYNIPDMSSGQYDVPVLSGEGNCKNLKDFWLIFILLMILF